MRPMRGLVVASFLLAGFAICQGAEIRGQRPEVGGHKSDGQSLASDLWPLDSWRQTGQGWQRCEDFLGPPIEYASPALHPLVVGALEVLLSVAALLALGDGRRATPIEARRAGEAH